MYKERLMPFAKAYIFRLDPENYQYEIAHISVTLLRRDGITNIYCLLLSLIRKAALSTVS